MINVVFILALFFRPNVFFISILKKNLDERSVYFFNNLNINLVMIEIYNYFK